ncbi:MAG: N-acetylmuramoyl-L-alanine amidase [Deltaproteobacteria bacterium]|nr:N-acetylmuramoyl-L-alanine amidase [Deltaproteobacteria bacterium]
MLGLHVMALCLHVAAVPQAERVRQMVRDARASGTPSPWGAPLFPAEMEITDIRETEGALVVQLRGLTRSPPWQREVVEELQRETLLGSAAAHEVTRPIRWERAEDGAPLWHSDARAVSGPPVVEVRKERPTGHPWGRPLAGRRIALSAGHGWLDNGGSWSTQRVRWAFTGCGACRGITEDFFTAELVTGHVIPLLENMGATVVLVREPDLSDATETLVDNGDAAYGETGTWADGTATGGWDGDYRAYPGVDGVARFDVAVGAPGRRRASARYVHGTNRNTSAVLTLHHAGGNRVFNIDQTQTGTWWMDLGEAFFDVEGAWLTWSANPAAGYLVADAVKVGGGMFAAARKPFWQMAAESYVPWSGAPADVTARGDVTIRPAFVQHVGADVYVSIHANASGVAGGSSANGISTYRYSCWAETAQYSDHTSSAGAAACDDPPGSRELLDTVHAAVLARLRQDWDPNYRDRGRLVANFGEVRELTDIPGILIETGFFDNLENPSGTPPPRYADNRTLHDPRWRDAFAHGLAEGLARYLGAGTQAPPLRPTGVRAVNQPDGTLRVAWDAVTGADAYRVYVARHERAWDEGAVVNGMVTVLADVAPGEVVAVRVAALGEGGEGFPSQAVVARRRGAHLVAHAPAELLVLQAYDRRDAWVQTVDNDLNHAVEHAEALRRVTGMDVYFDGALDEAVEQGAVSLSDYRVVDFAAGKDSAQDESVSTAMQGLLRAYRDAGGGLFISGEEIGYDLVDVSTDPADEAFLSEVLLATYVADDAETYIMQAPPTGPFSGLADLMLDDGTGGVYEVVYPDVMAPTADAEVALVYPDGRAAAVAGAGLVFLGAPLEAVVPVSSRAALLERVLRWLVPELSTGDTDLDGASDACETAYGLDPLSDVDGPLDADGDGTSNAVECQRGTSPVAAEQDGGTLPDAGTWTDAGNAQDSGSGQPDPGGAGDAPSSPSCGCGTTGHGGTPLSTAALVLLAVAAHRRKACRRTSSAPQ